MYRLTFLITSILFMLSVGSVAANEADCLTEEERKDGTLYAHLQRSAYEALDRRAAVFETLTSPDRIAAYQQRLRGEFIESLGGFPERSPLEAKTVRTIAADGYRIEMVIFASRPNHHITANLYLPDSPDPVPGIVVSSGHSRTAKTADYNQRFGIMMARNGMAALCFDPIGQGERSQILDDKGQPKYPGTTTEHALIGVGSQLVGRNTATYRIWDGIRAIDYLSSRPEIDPQRIGYTGCSGGGTLTSYVMALDDRVACAAPACYLTSFRRLIETIGPQDAEQNIFAQLQYGMDHADYIILRTPKPTLISATTDDFFDINGTWDTFREAKRIYARLEYPERVDLVEVAGGHGVKPQNLATIAHWMQRWLLDKDAPISPVELETREPQQLLCTETGQVLTSLAGELAVSDLNAAHAKQLAREREKHIGVSEQNELRAKIARQLRLTNDDIAKRPPAVWTSRGTLQREGYSLEKGVLNTTRGVPMPVHVYRPPGEASAVYLYLHPAGKSLDETVRNKVEQLVSDGNIVVAVDLYGQGETATGERDPLLTDWKTFNLAYLLGKSLVGLRVEGILAVAEFAARLTDPVDPKLDLHLVGIAHGGIVALHAAALEPHRFSSVRLKNVSANWADVVANPAPAGQLESVVPGALMSYDLPELVRLIGTEKIEQL